MYFISCFGNGINSLFLIQSKKCPHRDFCSYNEHWHRLISVTSLVLSKILPPSISRVIAARVLTPEEMQSEVDHNEVKMHDRSWCDPDEVKMVC